MVLQVWIFNSNMATFIMLPDGDVLTEWDASGGGTAAYTDVDNDDGNTQYAFSNTNAERFQVTLAAPSVAEADIDMSAGITVTIKASASKTLSGTSYVDFYQLGTAADSSVISNGYDRITVPSGGYTTYSGTAETTSDGSDVWVYGDLAGLQIRIIKFRNDRFGQLRISYLYAEVDYTAAVTDNATFFGANF
jgi:hypothetical protein